MNLIKSFNFNFLKQNIKKSKGVIILSLIIVPLILSMYLVVAGIGLDNVEIVPTEVVGAIDLVFMYVIPFVYSVLLFGFVFKKPSTDFMNSMPINRKTMFVTNTIGGIILITIIQLLSGLFAVFWGTIFRNLIIFPAMILDIMIVSWISYVFIFVASNLAISISGTQQAHFVSLVLILFLIPIMFELVGAIRKYESNDYNYGYYEYGDNNNYDISIANGYQTTYYNISENVKNYTMPFKLFRYGLTFSWSTNIRMLLLSVVYFVLGLKLYQKKKMEYSEETFANQKMHIIVKSLTLIPILLFVDYVNVYSDSITGIVIAIIFCAIYYFLFDIIAKRKVKITTTVASFAVTVFVIQSMVTFIGNIDYKKIDIDAEDIKEISLGKSSKSVNSYFYYNGDDFSFFDGDYFIKDNQILNLILDGRNSFENNKVNDFGEYNGKDIFFNIKLNNGKIYCINTRISEKSYKELIKIVSRNDEYTKHLKNQICKKNGIIQVNNDVVDNKTRKKLEKEMNNDLNILSVNSDSINYIKKTVYKNHKLVQYKIPLNNNEKLIEIAAEYSNNQALENIKGYQYDINVTIYDKNGSVGSFYDNSDILDFMEKHAADEFNPNKKYFIISGGLQTRKGYKSFTFYTNDTSEVNRIMKKTNSNSNNRYWD